MRYGTLLDEQAVLSFMEKRCGKLEAVVLGGGEPTLQHDLADFQALAELARGASRYMLERFQPWPTLVDQSYLAKTPPSLAELQNSHPCS